jgi:predicted MFS family arabinose efflux permease
MSTRGCQALDRKYQSTVVAPLLFGWAIGASAVFVGLQTWIIREAALPASAIYVAIFNASIGSGALLGSKVIVLSNRTAWRSRLPWAAAAPFCLSFSYPRLAS